MNIYISGCGEEYCTYTIGYWGNHIDEVEAILAAQGGAITVGGYTLTTACLDYILPGPPKHKKNKVHCDVTYAANNNNLRQSIGMILNSLNAGSGAPLPLSLALEDIHCQSMAVEAAIIQGAMTVQDLIDCAMSGNNTCGQALGDLNVLFDECQLNVPCPVAGLSMPTPEYSQAIDATRTDVVYSISIYPNPTPDVLNLNINATTSEEFIVSVINIQGKVVLEYSSETVKGLNNYQLDVHALEQGIYYLKFQYEQSIEVKSFVKMSNK